MDVPPNHSESSNSLEFRENFIRFLSDKPLWFVRIVFWAVAQYVRGDHDLRNRDDCDATLKQILDDLAHTITPSNCTPMLDVGTSTNSDGIAIIRNHMEGPYNCIQVPTKGVIIKDPQWDRDVLFNFDFLPRAYNTASSIDIDGLIRITSWIIHQKRLDLNDISFALRTLWVPAFMKTLQYKNKYDYDVKNGCCLIDRFDFCYEFNEVFIQWFTRGFYPDGLVPPGCDPFLILHAGFPDRTFIV
jgi:hypothetical protein